MLVGSSSSPSFSSADWYHSADDLLGCGTRRHDHDDAGHCNICEVCNHGLCPADEDDVRELDGDYYHRNCLLLNRRARALHAVDELIAAYKALEDVSEEELILAGDNTAEQCDYYGAVELLQSWTKRNREVLASMGGGQ